MMIDLVERLRSYQENISNEMIPLYETPEICLEAAEEIARLRAENEALRADADLLNWLVKERQGWFSRLCPNPIFPGQTYKSVLYDAYKQWREKI
jgi:hypothetical protein